MNSKIIYFLVLFFSIILFPKTLGYTESQLESANSLANKGIINNHNGEANLYNLDSNVLRQEIAAVARSISGLAKSKECKNLFSDLSSINPNNWACLNIEPLLENNLIAGNIFFRPEDNITKAEALGMLVKAMNLDYNYDSENSDSWQKQVTDFGVENNLVSYFEDYETFATRGWIFEIANHYAKDYIDDLENIDELEDIMSYFELLEESTYALDKLSKSKDKNGLSGYEGGEILICGDMIKFIKIIPPYELVDAPYMIYDFDGKYLGKCGGMPGPNGFNDSELCSLSCNSTGKQFSE